MEPEHAAKGIKLRGVASFPPSFCPVANAGLLEKIAKPAAEGLSGLYRKFISAVYSPSHPSISIDHCLAGLQIESVRLGNTYKGEEANVVSGFLFLEPFAEGAGASGKLNFVVSLTEDFGLIAGFYFGRDLMRNTMERLLVMQGMTQVNILSWCRGRGIFSTLQAEALAAAWQKEGHSRIIRFTELRSKHWRERLEQMGTLVNEQDKTVSWPLPSGLVSVAPYLLKEQY